jgi:hypothetical protein
MRTSSSTESKRLFAHGIDDIAGCSSRYIRLQRLCVRLRPLLRLCPLGRKVAGGLPLSDLACSCALCVVRLGIRV